MKNDEIDILLLKKAVNSLLDHIVNDLGRTFVRIEEDQDLYWEIPSSERPGTKDLAPQADVGRLSDDLDFIRTMVRSNYTPPTLMLVHVAPLLKYVGETVGE